MMNNMFMNCMGKSMYALYYCEMLPFNIPALQCVKGTRQIQCIRNIPGKIGMIQHRNLSCFCNGCQAQDGKCENVKNVDKFYTANILASDEETGVVAVGKKRVCDEQTPSNKEPPVLTGEKVKDILPAKKRRKLASEVKRLPNSTVPKRRKRKGTSDAELSTDTSSKVLKAVMDRKAYYQGLEKKLIKMSFEEMKNSGAAMVDVFTLNHETEDWTKWISPVDQHALTLYPEDAPENFIPHTIEPDGNCLPRCGSVFLFGHEGHHCEVRIRTMVELATHEDYYLSNEHNAALFQYMENYIPGVKLTEARKQQLFR